LKHIEKKKLQLQSICYVVTSFFKEHFPTLKLQHYFNVTLKFIVFSLELHFFEVDWATNTFFLLMILLLIYISLHFFTLEQVEQFFI